MHRLLRGEQGANALRRMAGARHAGRKRLSGELLQADVRHTHQEIGMQMVGAGRERAAGAEDLLEELAVGRVRHLEGPADRCSLTKKSGVHPCQIPSSQVVVVPVPFQRRVKDGLAGPAWRDGAGHASKTGSGNPLISRP